MIKKIGILGAGAMGGGIAHLAAAKGFEVVLCDVEQRFVEGAIKRIAAFMDKSIEKQNRGSIDTGRTTGQEDRCRVV